MSKRSKSRSNAPAAAPAPTSPSNGETSRPSAPIPFREPLPSIEPNPSPVTPDASAGNNGQLQVNAPANPQEEAQAIALLRRNLGIDQIEKMLYELKGAVPNGNGYAPASPMAPTWTPPQQQQNKPGWGDAIKELIKGVADSLPQLAEGFNRLGGGSNDFANMMAQENLEIVRAIKVNLMRNAGIPTPIPHNVIP